VGPDKQRWANTDYYAYLWGQSTFANPEAVNINLFVTPGIDYVNNSNLVESAIDMIETDRADSVYICTTPDYNMFVNNTRSFTTDFIYPEESVDNLDETGIDSNYTATYYPWVLTRDSVNNTQVYIPPTAEVVRNLALTDNIAFPWFASAGYTRGLVNSVKARKKLTQEDRDILYKGRINPIATFSDVGTVIWGNKTLQVRESALDRINVRRLLLQARKLISAVAVRLLFDQNDQQVRQEFLDSVNPILENIRRDRGLIDFRVVVTDTPEDLDSNTLTGKIYIKPTRALEFIDIEFLITPTGASFEDV
jgi:phage tail sheath protein FI